MKVNDIHELNFNKNKDTTMKDFSKEEETIMNTNDVSSHVSLKEINENTSLMTKNDFKLKETNEPQDQESSKQSHHDNSPLNDDYNNSTSTLSNDAMILDENQSKLDDRPLEEEEEDFDLSKEFEEPLHDMEHSSSEAIVHRKLDQPVTLDIVPHVFIQPRRPMMIGDMKLTDLKRTLFHQYHLHSDFLEGGGLLISTSHSNSSHSLSHQIETNHEEETILKIIVRKVQKFCLL